MKRMILGAIALFSVMIVAHAQTAPSTRPSAADLEKEVKASEDWIDHVKSLHMRFTGGWKRTPESIVKRTQALHKQFPTTTITAEKFPELRPQASETLEIAFDNHRIFYDSMLPNDMEQKHIWDGTRATAYEFYFPRQESYNLRKTPYPFFNHLLGDLGWPRAGSHDFWWHGPTTREMLEARTGGTYTEGFEIVGPEKYHGIDCWVMHSYGPNYVRWYVGVDDHLLHGWMDGLSYDKDPRITQLAKDIVKTNAPDIQSMDDFNKWVQTLPQDQSAAVDYKFIHEWGKLGRQSDDFWLMDYKEVAPGKFFPMTQGYSDEREGSTRELHAVEVTLDEPLPDDLFKVEIKDGVNVYDATHDPPLSYQSKHDRTPAEWQQIIDKAVAQKKMFDDEKARENAIVGKPAVPFPKTTWLNGSPLTWDDLKGKVVILDFFAEWCGPCRNDWPTLAAMHKKRDETGIVIIGIHTPGSQQAQIDKVLKEFDMQYPICIDTEAPKGSQAFGMLSAAYGVRGIPHSFVIGPDGMIAGHGSLGPNLKLAYELVEKQKAATQPTTQP